MNEKTIDEGSTEVDARIIGEADLIIFALYPHVFQLSFLMLYLLTRHFSP